MLISLASLFILFLPVKSLASTNMNPFIKLENVVVVGGTHGNEYTGVWCIKALDRKIEANKIQDKYPSINVSTLLGNPEAHLENKRFIHEDLNRQFTREALDVVDGSGNPLSDDDDLPIETLRAREIDQLLGPKFSNDDSAHVVIDLHSTTSNMGLTIIVAEGDSVMTRAAAYVMKKCQESGEKVNCLLHTHPSRDVRPNLSSAGRHGFTIEVGPVPQGVLRHDAAEKTELAIVAIFEYLHLYNSNQAKLNQMLIDMYSSGSGIPCYRSAAALREGEMSGKIVWPSVPENPNFPAFMIHKHLQDRDFEVVRTGDALFVDLDGNVIPYDGSFGESIHLMFVNEGGYYYQSSGTGIAVAVKAQYDLETGMLLPMEDDGDDKSDAEKKDCDVFTTVS